jgi:hypothetical protein
MRLPFERYILGSFVWLILLTSCASKGKISIQVPVPPKMAFPKEIQSVVLMNRSMTEGFSVLNQDSLQSLFNKMRWSLRCIFLDSVASDTTIKILGNQMYESGRFDVVVPLSRNLPNNIVSLSELINQAPSLNLAEVKQICHEFDVDALLSMENFYEKTTTSFWVTRGEHYSNGAVHKEYEALIQVESHSDWKIYQPLEKLIVAKFNVKDTIYWKRTGNWISNKISQNKVYKQLPTIKEALIIGAIEHGKRVAEYISPGWKPDMRRYYLTGNKDADSAVVLLKKNDWEGTEVIWMKFCNESSAVFRSKIEFNLALASEMSGNLNEAVVWAKKSNQSRKSATAKKYLKILNARSLNN